MLLSSGVVAALYFPVVFGLTLTLSSRTSTDLQCNTLLTTKSVKGAVPTTTKTTTKIPDVVVVVSKSTPIQTVTGKPSTTTLTSTSTFVSTVTDSTVTDTASTTSTIYSTQTSTSTSTYTSTVTISSFTSTSTATMTIATSAGFTPIYDSSGLTNYQASNKEKRDAAHPHGGAYGQLIPRANSNNALCASGTRYPAAVTCTKKVQVHYTEVVILAAPTRTSTIPGSRITTTVVQTVTSTSTIFPSHVTSIESFSVTSTTTSTTLASTTVVSTETDSFVATSTVTTYGACQTNNILGPRVNTGQYVGAYTPEDSTANIQDVSPVPATAYDCCVVCANTAGCQLMGFTPGECLIQVAASGTCPSGQIAGEFSLYSTSGASIYWSNGACGTMKSSS